MARFLVDESLPYVLAESLSNSGHEATHAYDAGLRGASDEDVYKEAERHGVILLTGDLDFADTRRFPGGVGVVLVRIRGQIRGMDFSPSSSEFACGIPRRNRSARWTIIDLGAWPNQNSQEIRRLFLKETIA